VTSRIGKQLKQFDAGGDELRRVRLPSYMDPVHAVESPTESPTFIVSYRNIQLDQRQVSEVSTEGQVLRQFSGPLDWPVHIAIDSQGHVLVADTDSILLLDAQLALRRVIIDENQLNDQQPFRLCYVEQSGQLLVGLRHNVAVFDVLQQSVL